MKKENIDLLVGVLMILLGSILVALPHINIVSIKTVLTSVMSFYMIINFLKYAFTMKFKDYEGLQVSIASLVTCILAFTLDINNKPKYLAITILVWLILMSLIKLKKADYYHDRSNNLWTLKIFILSFFILVGLLTSINLYYNQEVQILVLG